MSQTFPDKAIHMGIFHFHLKVRNGLGIDIDNIGSNFSAAHFPHQQGCPFQGIYHDIRVGTALEAERGIRTQPVAPCRFTYEYRIETGAFQEYISRLFRNPACQPAEHAGDAHRLFRVAHHEVVLVQFPFHAVQCSEFCACRETAYNHLVPFDFIFVESVQRLSQFEQDVIGHIHDIVDGIVSDGFQARLQPFRGGLHFYPFDAYPCIPYARLGALYLDGDACRIGVGSESLDGGQGIGDVLQLAQVSCQVAGNSQMGSPVHPVRGNVHLDGIVIGNPVIFRGGHSHPGICRQDNDAVVRVAYADFILGANHAFRLFAAYFGFLDDKLLVSVIKHRADGCYYHFLSCCYVWRPAYDRDEASVSQIHRRDMQVVGIRMVFASLHFADNQALQSSADGFELFITADFQTDGGQYFTNLFDAQVCFQIVVQPVQRYIHGYIVLSFQQIFIIFSIGASALFRISSGTVTTYCSFSSASSTFSSVTFFICPQRVCG